METLRDRDDSSIEESDPFLGASLHSKGESQSQRWRRDVLLYSLILLLGISLGSHVLTYLYIHRASYLDAACVRHTQQNRKSDSHYALLRDRLTNSSQLLPLTSPSTTTLFSTMGHFSPTQRPSSVCLPHQR